MQKILAAITIALCAAAAHADEHSSRHDRDVLLVGDVGDNTVKRFDAKTGKPLGTLVAPDSGGLNGPMGLIPRGSRLLVANQNFGKDNGEILRFDARTGKFEGALVPMTSPNAPYAPRGIVRSEGNVLYVADLGTRDDNCQNEGRIARYHASNGKYLGDLDRRNFRFEFHPRGVVFGPDRLLYVSAIGCPIPSDTLFNPLTGYVLRFNAGTGEFVDVFASHDSVPDLHRPEGLVFDEDGHLWVTSFRANADDSDRLIKLDRKTGRQIDQLVLAPPVNRGGVRAFAQAIVFGPDGDLFVPISGGPLAGEIRRCEPTSKYCRRIVEAGGALQVPFYLIFENSDAATLALDSD
jgi:DNA-binding beta-propeller fold protein YncE